jgi:hypothetical protein
MNKKLSCPVCDRQEITESICPNCETDLSALRMLAELPLFSNTESLETATIPGSSFIEPIIEPIISENKETENREFASISISNNQMLLFIIAFLILFTLSNIVN